MAEPQPSSIGEGDQAPSAIPASNEDRKTATALSNLDIQADNDTTMKQADTEALGKAMKNLDVTGSTSMEVQTKPVKVDVVDVTLLAQQLDISKQRATELLKAHNADISEAITVWMTT